MAPKKTSVISVDIYSGKVSGQFINFTTMDVNTASLSFQVKNQENKLALSNVTPKIFLNMEDGSQFVEDCEIVDATNGVVQYTLKSNEIKHSGRVDAEFYLVYTDSSIGSFNFTFYIKKSAIDTISVPAQEVAIIDMDTFKASLEARLDDTQAILTSVQQQVTNAQTQADNITNLINQNQVAKQSDVTNLTTQMTDKVSQAALNTTNANVTANTNAITSHSTQITANATAIANIGNASPKGTYANLTALQTAFPSGTTGVYLVTADGKWYYWSGSAWTAGGTYQSTGLASGSVSYDILDPTLTIGFAENGMEKNGTGGFDNSDTFNGWGAIVSTALPDISKVVIRKGKVQSVTADITVRLWESPSSTSLSSATIVQEWTILQADWNTLASGVDKELTLPSPKVPVAGKYYALTTFSTEKPAVQQTGTHGTTVIGTTTSTQKTFLFTGNATGNAADWSTASGYGLYFRLKSSGYYKRPIFDPSQVPSHDTAITSLQSDNTSNKTRLTNLESQSTINTQAVLNISTFAPAATYGIDNQIDFSPLTSSTSGNTNYYTNGKLGKPGLLRGIYVGLGVTSINVVAAEIVNGVFSVKHSYGSFNLSNGYATINDSNFYLRQGQYIFVQQTGTFNFKSASGDFYQVNSDLVTNFKSAGVQIAFNVEISDAVFTGSLTKVQVDALSGSVSTNTQDITNIKSAISYKKPSGSAVVDVDYDFSTFTSTSTSADYYSNGKLQHSGFLRSVSFATTMTQAHILAAKVNSDNSTITITHDYGTFPIVSGVATVNDDQYLLSTNEQILISQTGGSLKYKFGGAGIELYSDKSIKALNSSVIIAQKLTIDPPVDAYRDINSYGQNLDDLTASVNTNASDINDLKNKLTKSSFHKSVYTEDFSTVKSDWINSGWTIDTANKQAYPNGVGGLIVNSTTGVTALTNYLRLNKQYNADKRIMSAKVILYADTVVNLHFVRTTDNSGEGESWYQIDVPNKKLTMYKTDTDTRGVSLTLTSAQKNITEFNFVAGNKYMIEVEKDNWDFTLRLYDMLSANVSEVTVSGWDAGRQNNTYAFSLQSGTAFKLTSFDVSIINNPSVIFYGDSITEGVGMSSIDPTNNNRLENAWAYVLKDIIGNSINSGMGGDTSDGVIARLQSEAQFLNPKFVVVTIGTNGGTGTNTQAKYQQIINLCNSMGTTLILNHIPANYSGSVVGGNAIAVNQLIDSLGVKVGCKFDVATSINHDPSQGDDSSLFIGDNTHPNYLGAAEMIKRVYIDAPEILIR
jgi:lysophospholipase L1-like esterase